MAPKPHIRFAVIRRPLPRGRPAARASGCLVRLAVRFEHRQHFRSIRPSSAGASPRSRAAHAPDCVDATRVTLNPNRQIMAEAPISRRSARQGSGPASPLGRLEVIGDTEQSLMALELGSAAAKIAVAIFETCRHIVEDRAFDAAADRPAVKTVLVAPGSRSVGEAHRGPDILVAAARVQQGVVAYEIACANAQIERIFGIDAGDTVAADARDTISEAEVETALDGEDDLVRGLVVIRSEEHTSELQSLMRISYDVFCLKKKTNTYMTINSKNHITITKITT